MPSRNPVGGALAHQSPCRNRKRMQCADSRATKLRDRSRMTHSRCSLVPKIASYVIKTHLLHISPSPYNVYANNVGDHKMRPPWVMCAGLVNRMLLKKIRRSFPRLGEVSDQTVLQWYKSLWRQTQRSYRIVTISLISFLSVYSVVAVVFLIRQLAAPWIATGAKVLFHGSLLWITLLRCIAWLRFESAVRRELLAGRFSVCISCGYDLRELSSSRCPECGEVAGTKSR